MYRINAIERNWNNYNIKDIYIPCYFLVLLVLSLVVKKWKQPTLPSIDEQMNKCGIFTCQGIKNGNHDICNYVDKSGEHYVKWNKPDTEMHMLSSLCRTQR